MKLLLPTVLFYGIAIPGMEVLEKISPTGSCNPGLGFMTFLLVFIPVVTILLVRNIYLAFARNKKYWIVLVFHALITAVLIILISKEII